MDEPAQATEEMTILVERREHASQRVAELEAGMRDANAAITAVLEELRDLERQGGGTAPQRRKLEEKLATARARATEEWPARLEGARLAVADAHAAVQVFVAEHLTELVEAREEVGRAFAAQVDAAARMLLDGYSGREAVAQEISQLASMVGRVHPGDVSRSRCEALAREASSLLAEGGERVPELLRDPREPRHGQPEAADEQTVGAAA